MKESVIEGNEVAAVRLKACVGNLKVIGIRWRWENDGSGILAFPKAQSCPAVALARARGHHGHLKNSSPRGAHCTGRNGHVGEPSRVTVLVRWSWCRLELAWYLLTLSYVRPGHSGCRLRRSFSNSCSSARQRHHDHQDEDAHQGERRLRSMRGKCRLHDGAPRTRARAAQQGRLRGRLCQKVLRLTLDHR